VPQAAVPQAAVPQAAVPQAAVPQAAVPQTVSEDAAPQPQVLSSNVQVTTSIQPPLQLGSQAYGLITEPNTGRQVYVPPPCPNRVPTIAGIDHIDPITVFSLLRDNKCMVIDLRGEDRAAGLIEGAIHVPAIDKVPFLTRVPDLVRQWSDEKLVIFTCQYSAHRAPQCANWYRQQANPSQQVGILSGGFRGWESVGLPVQCLASVTEAQAADEKALQLGSQFVSSAAAQGAQPNVVTQVSGQLVGMQQVVAQATQPNVVAQMSGQFVGGAVVQAQAIGHVEKQAAPGEEAVGLPDGRQVSGVQALSQQDANVAGSGIASISVAAAQ